MVDIILKAVTVIIITVATLYVIPAVRSFIDNNKDTRLYNFIETAVRAAEQLYPESGSGADKKKYVMHTVCKWLGEQGYDEKYLEVIETILEECVYMLKNDN